jgi:hypothetical protein
MFPGWSTYSAAWKYVDQSREYINYSQTQFPEKEYISGIFLAVSGIRASRNKKEDRYCCTYSKSCGEPYRRDF